MARKKVEVTVSPKKEVTASSNSKDVSGFGENVVKLTDKESGETVCFLGKIAGNEQVFFGKAVSPDQVEAVAEFLQRKKIHKHIENNHFDKAQDYANRKF